MSNRQRRDASLVETHEGTEGVFADDLDGFLGHIGQNSRYAERTVDVTPGAVRGLFNERIWRDGSGTWDGVLTAASVYLGKVEPGTFWLIEHLIVAPGLAASLGFAYIVEGVSTTSYARRARVQIDAGGAYSMFAPPLFVGGGDVFVRCVQNVAAADTVVVSAQIRIVAKS